MKLLLNFCLFGIIGACGVDKVATDMPASEPVKKILFVQPRETLAGDYLAGQFAQRQQDWVSADKFMNRVMDYDPENIELQKRAMVLAMGAGEVGRAVAMARKVLVVEPENQLALLFMALDDFSRQDYDAVLSHMTALPDGSIAELIRPLLTAWANVAKGTVDLSGFDPVSPLHAYHGLMIGDYAGTLQHADIYSQRLLHNQHLDFYEAERIADILARHNLEDKALALYELIRKQQPENETVAGRVDALKKGGKISKGDATHRISTPEEGAAEALFDMARMLYREQGDDSAMVFTRMALHLNPQLIEARLVLASVLARHNRLNEAIDQFLSIGADKSVYLEAQRQAAMLMEQNGRRNDAIALMENIFSNQKDVDSLIIVGDIYRRAEDYLAAIDAYDRAEKALGKDVSPADNWELFYARGMAYERLGHMDKADADLRRALTYQPDHPYLLNYLGYSWVDRGKNMDEAISMIEKAVSLRPDDGFIVDSLGWAHYQKGEYEQAAEILEKAVALVPYDATISDHLGDAYWRVGRHREARFEWHRSLNNLEDETKRPELQSKIDNGLSALIVPDVKEAKQENAPQAR
jgi:tetratricopeptide (TPR) repeat protein